MVGPASLSSLSRWLRRRETAFLLVGGINTAFGLSAFALFEHWLGGTTPYLVNLLLAYGVGIAVGFVLHRRFVFRVQGNVLRDLAGYCGVQAGTFGLNAAILPLLVEVVGLPVLPAQVLSLGTVVVASYFGHALISFRRPAPAVTGAVSRE